MNRIAVIGNGGGGKTTISRRLHQIYQLPLTHVDSIQFLAGMIPRNTEETRSILNQLAVCGPIRGGFLKLCGAFIGKLDHNLLSYSLEMKYVTKSQLLPRLTNGITFLLKDKITLPLAPLKLF